MTKKIGLTLFGVIVLSICACVPLLGQSKSQPVNARKTLHEQAKKAGGKFVLTYRPSRTTIYPNIEELAKRSDLIVVGRTLSHKASLTSDESFITQDFLVKVQEIIKGDLSKGTAILVSLPGGTHRFADKTFVAIMPAGYTPIKDGGIYVFFLKSKKKGSIFRGLRPVSENQGMFALTNAKVEPADSVTNDPVSLKYRDMSSGAFLQQIHKAVPRKGKQQN
jgi:hypothetical protein